eukprot:s2855_g11.t1
MAQHDKPVPRIEIQEEPYSPSVAAAEINMKDTFSDIEEAGKTDGPSASSASAGPQLQMQIPQTPPDGGDVAPVTPRTSPSTRLHAEEPDEHDSKPPRAESFKKSRLQRISSEHAAMIRMVKFADETFPTMDGYQADLNLDDHLTDDPWYGEDEVSLEAVPVDLWSDCPLSSHPDHPEQWVDRLADQVELKRLCGMNVLQEVDFQSLTQEEHLTAKFVYDWRIKDCTMDDGSVCRRWLRRSRLVAREFSFWEKRDHLQPCDLHTYPEFAANVVKPMSVSLLGKTYKVCKNLPGQRLGAKAWYWSFREMLAKELDMQWCQEQPCLARNDHCCIMLHVDDVMFCGDSTYWSDVLLQKLKNRCKISFSQLEGVGSEISFLKKTLKRLESGLAFSQEQEEQAVQRSFKGH